MNELIKELAEQAGYKPLEPRAFADDLQDIFLAKFAELIVRQCIKSTLSLHDAAVKHNWGTEETFHIIVDDMVEQFDMQYIFRS